MTPSSIQRHCDFRCRPPHKRLIISSVAAGCAKLQVPQTGFSMHPFKQAGIKLWWLQFNDSRLIELLNERWIERCVWSNFRWNVTLYVRSNIWLNVQLNSTSPQTQIKETCLHEVNKNISGSFSGHFWSILGSFADRFESIFGLFQIVFRPILRVF